MTASNMGNGSVVERTLQEFWNAALIMHGAVAELELALNDAQKSPSSEKEVMSVAEEKMRVVYNIIHERIDGLNRQTSFAERHGQDPIEMQQQEAKSLMVSLPEKWQKAETALGPVAEGLVMALWEDAKEVMELLLTKWEELSAIEGRVDQ